MPVRLRATEHRSHSSLSAKMCVKCVELVRAIKINQGVLYKVATQ